MTDHREMEALLATYRDLKPSQRAEVDAHVDGCDPCNELRASFENQDELLAELDGVLDQMVEEILDEFHMDYTTLIEEIEERERQRRQRLRRAGQGALILSGLLLTAYLLSRLLIGWMPAPEILEEPTPWVPTPSLPTPVATLALDLDPSVWTGVAAALALEEQAYLPDSTVSQEQIMQGTPEWLTSSLYLTPWSPPWGGDREVVAPMDLRLDHIEHIHNDLALVRIGMKRADSPDPRGYVPMWRVYRETERGWIWTAPPAEMWGEERTMRTRHFHLHYRALDAPVVEEVATLLEPSFARYLALLDSEDEPVRTLRFDPTVHVRNLQLFSLHYPSPYFLNGFDGMTVAQMVTRESLVHAARNAFSDRILPYGDPMSALSRGILDWAILRSLSFEHRDDFMRIALARTIAREGPIALDELSASRASGPEGAVAQAMGRDFFLYIEREYGFDAVRSLLRGEPAGESWPEALETVTGLPLHELDARWRQWMRIRYTPVGVTGR